MVFLGGVTFTEVGVQEGWAPRGRSCRKTHRANSSRVVAGLGQRTQCILCVDAACHMPGSDLSNE